METQPVVVKPRRQSKTRIWNFLIMLKHVDFDLSETSKVVFLQSSCQKEDDLPQLMLKLDITYRVRQNFLVDFWWAWQQNLRTKMLTLGGMEGRHDKRCEPAHLVGRPKGCGQINPQINQNIQEKQSNSQ